VSRPVRFHPLAEADLAEAWSWYEERQPGLGDQLVRAVRTALDMAARWPSSGTPVIEDHDGEVVERRITTSGFPYAVRYRTIDEAIVVMAVYHQRRRPDFGAERSP
jgi:plasmid stabilization system protein ParE